MNHHAILAHRLGAIFDGTLQLQELRYPAHAKHARSLLKDNPSLYGQITESLLNGQSTKDVAIHFNLNHDFIRFIARIHPEIHDVIRSEIINNLESTLASLSNRLFLESDSIPTKDLPKAIAAINDQLALLCGSPTARVEHSASVPSREKLLQMFNSLKDINGHPRLSNQLIKPEGRE